MTPEETIAAADLMRRYAESVQAGRPITIECRCGAKPGRWIEAPTPMWDWHAFEYRERPAPKYRPYATLAEVPRNMVLRRLVGDEWVTINRAWKNPMGELMVGCSGIYCLSAQALFDFWVIDATGEPAGVRVEP